MEKPHSLEQVIKTYINLQHSTGDWYQVVCKVCNDHGRKGPRAGFRFDDDVTGYHCFNCGHSAKDDPSQNKRISKNMVKVLDAFGVPEDQWKQLELQRLGSTSKQKKQNQAKDIEPTEVKVPQSFYFLSDADNDDKWAEIARLKIEERGIDPNQYPFMLSKDKRGEPWYGRVIIPIFKDKKIIYFQGRDLTGKQDKKYRNPAVPKEKIMYGYDKLFAKDTGPLYIVEGFFDAFVIDGIAIFGNEISKTQSIWLGKSPRQKVYIPDRLGNGQLGAKQAIELGWSISTPDIGSCKDINEAVVKYGKLYVLKTITENTASGFEAEVKVGLYCK